LAPVAEEPTSELRWRQIEAQVKAEMDPWAW
jgi:hypothetical protein